MIPGKSNLLGLDWRDVNVDVLISENYFIKMKNVEFLKNLWETNIIEECTNPENFSLVDLILYNGEDSVA